MTMIRKRTWKGLVEEFPMNMWEVDVMDWVIGSVVIISKVFYRKCVGYDSKTAKPHVSWGQGYGISEDHSCPRGCLYVSGKNERKKA